MSVGHSDPEGLADTLTRTIHDRRSCPAPHNGHSAWKNNPAGSRGDVIKKCVE